jgi:NitT/TauT family transport system permease protein
LPIFRSFGEFLRKFRFLPSAGLSFLFMKMSVEFGGGIEQQMSFMMIWGISTWLMYSMIGIALSIGEDEIMYARSLRLSKWQMVRELLIKGKAVDILQAFIGNFAIAWMMLAYVENINKASGGIGVIISESVKYYLYDEVYAIQILILITGITIDTLLRKALVFLLPYAK